RTGTLTIAGQTFTVTQSGACSYTVTPLTQAVGVSSGTATFSVSTGASCTWTASSALSWAAIASPAGSATGSGSVTVQLQANGTTSPRSGAITIASQSATLNQPGTASVGSSTTDFNGDGIADTLSYNPTTGAWSMSVTGAGTVGSGSWPTGLAVRPLDLDGNGLTDMFGYNATSGAWMKAIDNGAGGFTTVTGTWWPGWQVSVLDLDGRGQYSVFLDNGVGLMTPLTTGIAGEAQTRPWLSSDRLRMYFSSTRGSGGSRTDLFMSSRNSTAAAFGAPVAIAELNLPTSNTAAPSLTSDELTIAFESDRAGGLGGADIWMATRATGTAAFSSPQPLSAINSSSRDGSPELSVEG